ncbi:hypothetical protein [Foetidibacter luteolus]|uniref:hypothetical protein n=1 Tax=Foetidibacter luteolus TaxID=2608880 RepID=UPI00129B96F6|nr:hypothetical protein [Foetidibacter luteolus]
MYYDLKKSDKKLAHIILAKGVDATYKKGLEKAGDILARWNEGKLDNRDAYMELFQTIKQHDKAIARRHNGLGGSEYLGAIAGLLHDGYVTEADIQDFSDEVKEVLKRWLSFFNE